MNTRAIAVVVLAASTLGGTPTASAQGLSGRSLLSRSRTISGVVRDQSGEPLAGVRVEARGEGFILVASDVTDARGAYRLENLAPAVYGLQLSREGYASVKLEENDLCEATRVLVNSVMQRASPDSALSPVTAMPPIASSGPMGTPPARIVCGMTIIPADPSLDPAMVTTLRTSGIEPTIQRVAPSICR